MILIIVVLTEIKTSGYLHIGHLKAALINYVIAKSFNGDFIMRFDDTNPAKESDEYVNAIGQDIKTMGIVPSKITCSSDYFWFLIECADALINSGSAYVDDTEKDTIKQERFNQIDSVNRANSITKNIELWYYWLRTDSCLAVLRYKA